MKFGKKLYNWDEVHKIWRLEPKFNPHCMSMHYLVHFCVNFCISTCILRKHKVLALCLNDFTKTIITHLLFSTFNFYFNFLWTSILCLKFYISLKFNQKCMCFTINMLGWWLIVVVFSSCNGCSCYDVLQMIRLWFMLFHFIQFVYFFKVTWNV